MEKSKICSEIKIFKDSLWVVGCTEIDQSTSSRPQNFSRRRNIFLQASKTLPRPEGMQRTWIHGHTTHKKNGVVKTDLHKKTTKNFKHVNVLTCASLTSSFQKHVEKVQNYIKEVWLILKKWVWRVDFELKKMFCFVKWAKTNVFSSVGKMEADKTAKSFPRFRILAFVVW